MVNLTFSSSAFDSAGHSKFFLISVFEVSFKFPESLSNINRSDITRIVIRGIPNNVVTILSEKEVIDVMESYQNFFENTGDGHIRRKK